MAETPPPNDSSRFSHDQVDWIVANWDTVELAKGILMEVFDVDACHAFEMIRLQARTSQSDLGLLAGQFVDDVSALTHGEWRDKQSACTHLLLTAHDRLIPGPEGVP